MDAQDLDALRAENQGLHAENGRLKELLNAEDLAGFYQENSRLRAEIERLRKDWDNLATLAAERTDEIERLRAALEGFMDCANQRMWPSTQRVVDARELLGRD